MRDQAVFTVDRLELTFAPRPWAFATERRAEIDAYFAALKRKNPSLWNGRILMLYEQRLEQGIFHGAYLETDYASFAAWIGWGWPQAGVYDCFGTGAIMASDGAFLLGVMSARTLNAGHIYFPCGTPDPSDIVDGKVDLDFSVRRELEEETGLSVAEFETEPGWTMVVDGSLIAQVKVFRARDTAEQLRERILAHLAHEERPELVDIRIARGPADLDAKMRGFVRTFLGHRWR